MANESLQDDLRNVWRQQPLENKTMPLEEIRTRAARFERRINRRNLREYIGGAVGVAIYWLYLKNAPDPLTRAGSALIVAGTLFIVWRLYRHGRTTRLPQDLGFSASLDFHRRQLVQQRDLLRGIFWWYIAPLLPGLSLFFVVAIQKLLVRPEHLVLVSLLLSGMIGALVWIWRINRSAAACLDRQIAEIDRLEREA
ncbi:MAG TPA: hypothetical protein VMJ75_02755 [Candidatus Acidoferrales bacterium]|nr:hypothetical protein [Candidatus Acidoferrales bacterium]